MEQKSGKTKGVKRQLFGAVLLSVTVLNSMLALKAGATLGLFNLAILSLGAALLASGLLAKRCSRQRSKQGRPI